MLTLTEFMQICYRSGNLYMLAGVRRLFEQRLYGPQMSEYIIDLVRDAFDLILIDCGNELDNGLALGALRRSDVRLLIVTQQESVLARYEALRSTYEMLKITYQKIIVNKYIQDDPHDASYLAKRMQRHKNDMIAVFLAKYARQAEIDYRTLLEYNEAGFREGIRAAAEAVLEEAGLEQALNTKAVRRWKSFI
jgi:MinD-like ATPase involved in chromosome partitioning or flagellar assembly